MEHQVCSTKFKARTMVLLAHFCFMVIGTVRLTLIFLPLLGEWDTIRICLEQQSPKRMP